MSTLDNATPTQLQGGLNKDFTIKPPTDVTFALNAMRDAHTGGKFQYQSEPGNELVESLDEGSTLCGWIYGQNNEIYLFSANGDVSQIGIFRDGFYDQIVEADLGFDPRYPITGEYRLKNGCERIVYWSDGNSPDYYFNFDRTNLFYNSDLNEWVPNSFRLIPQVLPPVIELVSVNDSGGNLPLGSYYFQVELLDSTLNSIYKTDITPQTIIYDDSISEPYDNIDGGWNIDQYTEEQGGIPITSKSITLRFSNLNTDLSFIRVNVARQLSGTQVIDAHAVASLIPINDTTISWTYKGYNLSAGDYPLDYSEMLTDNIRYDTAYIQEQVQGRLVRANLKQDSRDYSEYQRHASKVRVHWVADEFDLNDASYLGNCKNPETYWIKTSQQGDEIIGLGVQFIHTDGLWSPVFHIPGKPPANWDTTILTVVANSDPTPLSDDTYVWVSDVEHLSESDFDTWAGDYEGSEIQKWKVQNTAYITDVDAIARPYNYKGVCGYYEAEETYPDIRDCDGNLIWGVDYNEDTIDTDTKIRHHRIPDRRVLPHFYDGWGNNIGFQFSNISYPNSDIIGHRFCVVERDDFNKTVLDSGWMGKVDDNVELSFEFHAAASGTIEGIEIGRVYTTNTEAGDPTQITGQYGDYYSSNTLFKRRIFNPSYLKMNSAYDHDIVGGLWDPNTPLPVGASVDRTGGGSIGITVYHMGNAGIAGGVNIPNRQNYKVESQIFVPENGFVTASGYDVAIDNYDPLTPTNIIKTVYELENLNSTFSPGYWTPYVYKKNTVKPYGSLFNLNYKYLHLNYQTSTDTDDNIYYGGDSVITLSSPSKMIGGDPDSGVYVYTVDNYVDFYEEQQINVSLRHEGTDPLNKYYKRDGNYFWLLEKIAILQEDGTYDPVLKSDIAPEYYAYNIDYDKQFQHLTKQSLSLTYNYCSDCVGQFKNRIVFSPKSFDEETFDLYRINKVNDYIDIPGNRGEITGLKYKNNMLLVHCKEGTFIIQPNPQAITTNLADIYLTTGDFLGLPPAELQQNDIGYAGCQSKQHQCDTPYGWIWADQLRSQIFLFNGKLEDLSGPERKMSQWFNDNLPSELQYAFYQIFQQTYGGTATIDIGGNGVGLIIYFDPKYDRLFISKRDFFPINFKDRAVSIGDVSYNLNDGTWQAIDSHGNIITVNFDDIDYFENKSWTISYSFPYQTWTSWHSYIPPFAFFDNINYYTVAVDDTDVRRIFRHKHENSYQEFYGDKYDFIVEWMIYNPVTSDLNTIHYEGYTLELDSTNDQWIQHKDVTFDRGLIYNLNQSTGLFNINLVNQHTDPYTNIGFSNTTKNVIRTDDNYKLSGLYDLAVDTPVVTGDWEIIKTLGEYIDIVSNNANIDDVKNHYELNNIKDKFTLCRLYFNPEDDYKKIINIAQVNKSISIR